MNRRNQILLGVLIVQLILVTVLLWPRTAVQSGSGDPLFTNLDQIVAFAVYDAAGTEIELRKEGDTWVLPEAGNYPCQSDQVTTFLDKISELQEERVVTKTQTSHDRLKVSDTAFERKIIFKWPDNSIRILYIGTSPSYQSVHVRADGQDQVYLATNLAATDAGAQAANWIDTTYFAVQADQIVQLTLVNANGTFTLGKDEAGAWVMAELPGQALNENNVTSLVNIIAALRMIKPLGKEEKPSYGLDTPNAVLTVQTQNEAGETQSYELRVGAKDEATQSYVMASSTSPYYVRVAEYTAANLVDRTYEDFMPVPETE